MDEPNIPTQTSTRPGLWVDESSRLAFYLAVTVRLIDEAIDNAERSTAP